MKNAIGTILGFMVGVALRFAYWLAMTYLAVTILMQWGFL